ncbi:MAG: hypothetical protein KDC44_04805 [Phaeodactylibacter sp.]|nr:hypothetical protein [Phaeodactylibacter sp.]
MDPLLKKLNHQAEFPILLLNGPADLQKLFQAWQADAPVEREVTTGKTYPFVLVFAEHSNALEEGLYQVKGRLGEDAILWIAYPKKSSKKYQSDIHRDSGHWDELGVWGYEGVRQVAIDADWSALRFRQVDHIKRMKRSTLRALSEKGKSRTETKEGGSE